MTFCIIQQNVVNKYVVVLYKDSLKEEVDTKAQFNTFKDKIKGVFSTIDDKNVIVQYGSDDEQIMGVDCGIFALKNMQKIAEQIKNSTNFINDFKTFKFCTLTEAQSLRKEDFAYIYVHAWYKQTQNDDIAVQKREAIIKNHEPELDKILLLLGNDYKIKVLQWGEKLEKGKENNTIIIEIALPDNLDLNNSNSDYNYLYRVTWTNDITLESVKKHLSAKITTLTDIDFNIGDNNIRIPADRFTTVVKENKIITKDIKTVLKEVTLAELCKGLNVDESNTTEVQKIMQANGITLKGLETQEDADIGWINKFFGQYTLEAINNILSFRIKDLGLEDSVKIIPNAYFIDKNSNNINEVLIEVKKILANDENQTILVPLSLFNKHATSLIFTKNATMYIDPTNKSMSADLKQCLSNNHFSIEQQKVEQQKYANCGPKVVEDCIFYLTNKCLSQEKAIPFHSHLVEQDLLHRNYEDVQLAGVGEMEIAYNN